jgi:hypothetical protein
MCRSTNYGIEKNAVILSAAKELLFDSHDATVISL